MPINDTLPDITNPVVNRRGETATTQYVSHLRSIKVELLDSPSQEDLLEYIPRWCTATWNDKPHNNYSTQERLDVLSDLFKEKLLPTAMETIGLVFLISNIDLVDVTHLLRHRTMSFSAVCSADRDLRHETCLVKSSIEHHLEFLGRYMMIIDEAKRLYADMVDSDKVSMLDARTILPRCLEQHYYARVCLKDALHFIRQRIDRQIQPESDNVVALKMWIEIVKRYPLIKPLIDLNKPDMWYIKTVPTGRSSNIYMPEKPRNDVFEYKSQWFIYKKQRKEMLGGQEFINIWEQLLKELEEIC